MHRVAAKPGVRAAGPRPVPNDRAERRSGRRTFEPIPGAFAYGIGIVLVLLILAPFWLNWFMDSLDREPVLVTEDVESLQVKPSTSTNAAEPVMRAPSSTEFALDQYGGLRLDSLRDEIQQKFGLRLQNSPGMLPEIYVATDLDKIDQISAHVYNNRLKEFFMVTTERRVLPSVIERELTEEFGVPRERLETKGGSTWSGIGGLPVPATTAAGATSTDMAKKLETFARSRYLAWEDDENRVEATIYYTSLDSDQCVSVAVVHVSAARWLAANRPGLGTLSMPQPAPPPTEGEPKKLFP